MFGNITSSGNISASGTIIASNFSGTTSGTNTGDQNLTNLAVTGSNVIFANITSSGNISASSTVTANSVVANSLSLPTIATSASNDASFYVINGSRGEIRSQLQSTVAADTGWTLELRNTSIAANSLIVANVIGGAGGIITGSVLTANVVAVNTASFNFFNIGDEIDNNSAFTASFAIL